MEEIFLDRPIDNQTIHNSLAFLFPDLKIFYWDFMGDPPAAFDSKNKKHIFFNSNLYDELKEFSLLLSIYRTPNHDEMERAFYIAQYFEKTMKMRTLVPFQHPKHPNDPYYDIIFRNGQSYLADDCDTNWGDGTENLIKIVEPYPIPNLVFDKIGQKIG